MKPGPPSARDGAPSMQEDGAFAGEPAAIRSFTAALEAVRSRGRAPVVAEVKCRSPKEGDLLAGRDPLLLAAVMERAGAACISVVTEAAHFGGSMELLRGVAGAVSVPVLRKDFVTAAGEVRETRAAGASCLLLIAGMLEESVLCTLREEARRIGLEVLVEVRDEWELERALSLEPDLLGINNRDISVLETDDGDISRTLSLLRRVPKEVRVLSESSIAAPEEVAAVLRAGALGVLVGTSILRATDTAESVQRLVEAIAGTGGDGGASAGRDAESSGENDPGGSGDGERIR